MNIKYVNQKRILLPSGDVRNDWQDICHGHDLPYEAMGCNGMHERILKGDHDPRDFDEIIVVAETEMIRAAGFSQELRIIKRTTTDEAYDA